MAHTRALGPEGYTRVLASLYLARADSTHAVRQAALAVWKNSVANTPRTLRTALPTLLELVVAGLASGDDERADSCGRALGDVVKKLGERVLPTLLPLLCVQLAGAAGGSERAAAVRAGICAGFEAVIGSASKLAIAEHAPSLAPSLLAALCDPAPNVRAAAQRAFSQLHSALGARAVAALLPALLSALAASGSDPEAAERAMDGLGGLVAVRPHDVFPAVLPALLAPPLDVPRARALAAAAAAAHSCLHRHWAPMLDALTGALAGDQVLARKKGSPAAATTDISPASVAARLAGPLGASAAAIIRSVGEKGVPVVIERTAVLLQSSSPGRRRVAAWMLHALISAAPWNSNISGSTAPVLGAPPTPAAPGPDISSQIPLLLRELVARAGDADEPARDAAWAAVGSLVAGVAGADADAAAAGMLDFLRSLLSGFVSEARFRRGGVGSGAAYAIPTLCAPRGLEALLPLYLRALTGGSADARQSAAEGLGDLVDVTSAEGLKPHLVKIAGPLIRVAADKFPWPVKVAIVATLAKLVRRGGAALRPFAPQLQATFVRALGEPTAAVRAAGAAALTALVPLAPRVDALVGEIATLALGTDDVVCESALTALRNVIFAAGERVGPAARERAGAAAAATLGERDTAARHAAAAAAGAALRGGDAAATRSAVIGFILPPSPTHPPAYDGRDDDDEDGPTATISCAAWRDGRACALVAAVRFSPAALAATEAGSPASPALESVMASFEHLAKAAFPGLRELGARGAGWALAAAGREPPATATASPPPPVDEAAAARGAPAAPAPSDFTDVSVRAAFYARAPRAAALIGALLADASPDVRLAATEAVRRSARYGYAATAAAAPAAGFVRRLLEIVRGPPNAVLRAATDRALAALLLARGPNGVSVPPAALLAGLDAQSTRFLSDYWSKVLRGGRGDQFSDDEDCE